ncbi:MAG: signal peptidase I [Rhodospirillales bacterium]|nr:signal peptidase I [Rhodospirillales bacterium]
MNNQDSGGLVDTLKTILYAVLIALGVRTVAYEPFNIPSGSMFPTLLVGDYLFVSKFSYGYSKHSLIMSVPLISGRIFAKVPERGDVAVFKKPTDNTTDYIKRIVGLPGDKIQVINGILNINGAAVERKRAGVHLVRDYSGNLREIARYIETLPNGKEHYILEESDDEVMDNTAVYSVPEGHVFGMGDNRDNSQDSRYLNEVGFIPMENLVGRAEFLFFSIDDAAPWQFWKWGSALRPSRFFEGIE